jgi:serine phosphatase RsbU (regulator of sigma subunit)
MRGEVVTLMKTIGILLAVGGIIGWWNITFKFQPDPGEWSSPSAQAWAFSEWYHICYTGVFLSLILLLFKDNMVLLGATHRAAQIIAEEKKVMLDFLVGVAEDPASLSIGRSRRSSRQDLGHILRLALDFSMRQSDAKAGTIYLIDSLLKDSGAFGPGRKLIPRVVEGPYPPLQRLLIDYLETRIKFINELFLTETVDIDEHPFFRQLVEKGELLYLPETTGRDDIPQQPTDFLRINTLIAVPLRVQDQVLGILMVVNKLSDSERGWAPFTPQDASLLNAVGDQAAIAIANARMHEVIDEQERLEREIEIARKVQESLLPDSCPEIPGFEIQAFGEAAQQIGGDYYDFVDMGDNRIAIVVADVAGKGIPGALTMATLRSALRALAKDYPSARDLMIALNDFIFDDLKRDVFISVSLAILNYAENTLSLVRAGHEPPLIRRARAPVAEEIIPDGMALGLDRGSLFRDSLEEFTCLLEPGDLVVFYTDGVTEAMNENHEEFSLDRVVRLLDESKDEDLGGFVSRLREGLAQFTGECPPHDDVTVVTLQMKRIETGETA